MTWCSVQKMNVPSNRGAFMHRVAHAVKNASAPAKSMQFPCRRRTQPLCRGLALFNPAIGVISLHIVGAIGSLYAYSARGANNDRKRQYLMWKIGRASCRERV